MRIEPVMGMRVPVVVIMTVVVLMLVAMRMRVIIVVSMTVGVPVIMVVPVRVIVAVAMIMVVVMRMAVIIVMGVIVGVIMAVGVPVIMVVPVRVIVAVAMIMVFAMRMAVIIVMAVIVGVIMAVAVREIALPHALHMQEFHRGGRHLDPAHGPCHPRRHLRSHPDNRVGLCKRPCLGGAELEIVRVRTAVKQQDRVAQIAQDLRHQGMNRRHVGHHLRGLCRRRGHGKSRQGGAKQNAAELHGGLPCNHGAGYHVLYRNSQEGGRMSDAAPEPAAPAVAFSRHDHTRCAAAALAQAEVQASREGLRLTPVRRRALEILLEAHRALGAYEVLDRLAAEGYGRQPPVAYRALDFLVSNGLAHRIQRLNAYVACLHPAEVHAPVFLICRVCDAVAEAPGGRVRAALEAGAAEAGFAVERASVEAVGLCPTCRAQT